MSDMHRSFLEPFFIAMNEKFDKEWCVLHSYETLPDYSESDVDMAFSGIDIDSLEALILKVAKDQGWTLYQKLWYDAEQCFYYVLKEDEQDTELAIDFLIDKKGVGKYGFETTILTSNCNRWQDIVPIPNSNVAFSYKIVKRIVKQRDLGVDKQYLLEHFEKSDIQAVKSLLEAQYSTVGMKIFEPYLNEKNFLISKKDRKHLNQLKKKDNLIRFYWESRRILSRIFSPCGMILLVSTPLDEDALHSLVQKLEDKVGLLFRFVKYRTSSSLYDEFKSLVGSTLIIKRDEKNSLQTHWMISKKKKINIEETMNIELLSELYYKEILSALKERNRFKDIY